MRARSRDIVRRASMNSSRKAGGRGSRSTPRIASTARPATSRTRPRTLTGSCPRAEEDRIIPICRRLAFAALLLGTAAPAFAIPSDEDALRAYVRARAADVAGAQVEASHGYAAALALAPGNDVLAARALSEGLSAGDENLALAAARTLDTAGKLSPDGRILLAGEALKAGRWDAADAQIGKLAGDEVFSFAVPIVRAWSAVGSG